ncbi:inositol-polyphosphate 5-phosphatase, putative [Plasmodium malariae]|uniref:Inositol-polyphosphate 5-phosphatase, putative n=1 Tax=Plasmodium malariae TaxID=5858 RepID=A0A1C3KZA3_PLAMA|nr:inositol-polyphosphate 5-phosphatase, putative [Plasmodium malariae]
MVDCSGLPSKKFYFESHDKYLCVVNIENKEKNILRIYNSEDLKIEKEKEYINDKSVTENENKNRFWFFGCLGIIKAENTNFLVVVSDAEIICYLFNRTIYQIKKISFIQLNYEEEFTNSVKEKCLYEIYSLGRNGKLTKLNNNSKRESKKFFCNRKLKTQNYVNTLFDSSNLFLENCMFKCNKFYYNEIYIHKIKNSTLKNDTLKTIIYFMHAFNKGPFYFSYYYNLTVSLQRYYINESEKRNEKSMTKCEENNSAHVQAADHILCTNSTKGAFPIFDKLQFREINEEYAWNWKLLNSFVKLDAPEFVVFLTHGYINSNVIHTENSKIILYLISRKNKNRSGVRFWCRGGNDKGDVANFVETEQIVICKNKERTNVFSYILVRGSIPVLWKQQPTLSFRPKIHINPDMNENTQIVRLHMEKLKNTYGKISITNLINKKFGEKYLGQCFENCLNRCNVQHNYTWFDFHSEFKKLKFECLQRTLKTVYNDLQDFSYFSFSIPNGINYNLEHGEAYPSWSSIKIDTFQNGIFRVNCIDCLDRTNVFQSFLAKYVLYLQLKSIDIKLYEQNTFPFYFFKNVYDELTYRKIWINNANAISIIYSGAGALKNDITQNGKRTISGLFEDLFHVLLRYINNNFLDGYNNDCINLATNENIKYPINFLTFHRGKYNQIMQVFIEFVIIFSTAICTSPVQKLLKWVYFFSHNITQAMISQSVNYIFFFIRRNFHFFLFPYNQAKYFHFISILAKTSGIMSTSFLVFLFFCFYVFTQKRRVISAPMLRTTL